MNTVEKLMAEFLSHTERRHSVYQIDNFIIGEQSLTPYEAYHQSLRELISRYRNLKQAYWQIRNSELEVLRMRSMAEKKECPHRKEQLMLEADFKDKQLEDIRHDIRETEREFYRVWLHCRKYHEMLVAEGPITEQRRHTLSRESWEQRAILNLYTDLVSEGKFSKGSIKHLMMHPVEFQKKVLAMMAKPDRLHKWNDERWRPVAMPFIDAPDGLNVMALIESCKSEILDDRWEIPIISESTSCPLSPSIEEPECPESEDRLDSFDEMIVRQQIAALGQTYTDGEADSKDVCERKMIQSGFSRKEADHILSSTY